MQDTNNQKEKHILILGSGMMVEPLIDTLLSRKENNIHIATNAISAFNIISQKRPNAKLTGSELDAVNQPEELEKLVSNSDIVISYLPPILHEYPARACLKMKKNMVTTSYISPFLKSKAEEAKEKGIIFMNEIGLDPGLDHLISHRVINECERKGQKIIHYESWCGALCSPESLNNPLLYKFSWSPMGALNALKNNVKQMIKGKEIIYPNTEFLKHTTDKKFHNCFNFEGYYNRDSLHYKDLYKLNDAETVIRGTIRFQGFAFIFQSFKNLGFFDDKQINFSSKKNWKNYLLKEIICNEENAKKVEKFKLNFIKANQISLTEIQVDEKKPEEKTNFEEFNFYKNLVLFAMSSFDYDYFQKFGFENLFKKLYSAFKFLGFYEEENLMNKEKILDSFAELLQAKLKMEDWERDLVFMQNEFICKTKDGQLINKKYDLVVFGGHNSMPYSATSLLVSLPCATATQLILDGKIKEKGVLMPTSDLVINSVMEQLEKHRIFVIEDVQRKPKF